MELFIGHHDDLAYGTTWRGEPGRSDVKETAGSYPAVYGWDVSRLFRRGRLDQPSPEGQAQLRAWILEGVGRGGVASFRVGDVADAGGDDGSKRDQQQRQ